MKILRRKRWPTTDMKLNELKDNVAAVVPRPMFGVWLELQIPAMSFRTPLQCIAEGDLDQLLAYTRTYLLPQGGS